VFIKSNTTLRAMTLSTLTVIAAYPPASHAFDFGDMMNPGRWMDGNDRHDEPYYDGPYEGGDGYPPGAYGVPYGSPYGVPGFGPPPPAGYGPPGYYGGAPIPAAPVAPPPQSSPGNADQSEIEALKRRIEELETRQPPAQQPPSTDWPSAPAFRPMNQY
jgi:hypothetical protein